MKFLKILFFLSLSLIAACGGGDSSSGGGEATAAGQSLPANFVGTYTGTLNVTAEALGLSQSGSFPITVTVMANGMVRFDGDDPDETFTAGIGNDGVFRGSLSVDQDDCSGSVSVEGRVDGTTASGTLEGDGQCIVSGANVSAELSGNFNATM